MDELIERLVNASAGSRELDWECHKVKCPWLQSATRYSLGYTDVYGHTDDDELLWYEEGREKPYHDYLPHYTTSIDAALMLVPEGWFWRVGRTSLYQAWAGINKFHPDHCDPGKTEFFWKRELWEPPSTPAIALTIAALKARASKEPGNGAQPKERE